MDRDVGSGFQEPVLKATGISKRFGDAFAVQPLDLEVRRGEFLTLLGPSGCGKTTLLRMIAGFETASAGTISIDGRDLTHTPPYKRGLGMVFQSLALFPHLSVSENVAFGLRVRRQGAETIRQAVGDALELVGLPHVADRAVHQLSGGQRQRIALARAIVTKPPILLLDEPLSALDLKLRRQMQTELKHLQRRLGTTFIFVTHDQEEAITMSDRIAVMRQGRIEQIASPDVIYRQPSTTFVAAFVGENNIFDAEIETVAGARRVRVPTLDHAFLASDVTQDGPVSLAIRPENISLQRGIAGGDGLVGRIRERTFLGSNVRYMVEVANALVHVETTAADGAGSIEVDQAVTLTVPSDRMNVLRRQSDFR